MARSETGVEHLLRRAGFGASQDDLKAFEDTSTSGVLQYLLDYERQPDDVDSKMGDPAYASITAGDGFSPNLNIEHARQRWLFRMVHSKRPLQEKMALFWHNHFATAYSKIAGLVGGAQATRMMALKADELPGPQGQIELFRSMALGSFRDLLIEVARDPAMLVWLDGRLNTRQRPQENFGREIMELFTFGIGHYNEIDVYAASRVFTGWNLRLVNRGNDANSYNEFVFNANQHDTAEKTFTFPIYRNGNRTIPARAAVGWDAGRHRFHYRARDTSRYRATAGAEDVGLLRQRSRRAGRIDAARRCECVSAERHEHRIARALHAAVASISKPRQLAHALQLAGRVRRPGRQRSWLGGVLRRHAPRTVDDDGSDAVRAARCQRLGARPGMVHDRRHAGANEFRRHAGEQSAPQPGWRARQFCDRRRSRCSTSSSIGCRRRRSIRVLAAIY